MKLTASAFGVLLSATGTLAQPPPSWSAPVWDGVCDGLAGYNCWAHRECWFDQPTKSCCDVDAARCPDIPEDVDCATLDESICRVADREDQSCSWDNAIQLCGDYHDPEGECNTLSDKECGHQERQFKARISRGQAQCLFIEAEEIGSRCRDFVPKVDCIEVTDQNQCSWKFGGTPYDCQWQGDAGCVYVKRYEVPTTCDGMKFKDCNNHGAYCQWDTNTKQCEYISHCEDLANRNKCRTYAPTHGCAWSDNVCSRQVCTAGFSGEFCEIFSMFMCPFVSFNQDDYSFDIDGARSEANLRSIQDGQGEDYYVWRTATVSSSQDVSTFSSTATVDNRDTTVRFATSTVSELVSCTGVDGLEIDAADIITGDFIEVPRRGADSGDILFLDQVTCTWSGTGTASATTMFRGCENNPCDNGASCSQHLDCGLFTCDCSGVPFFGNYCELPIA